MAELVLTTFDWVPKGPRGFVRDIRVRWALEEAGLPYRVETISFRTRDDATLARQPFGQVPWLNDGAISIFESGAILLYLAERSEKLMPSDPRGRSDTIQWLFAALNSVEMASLPWALARFSGDAADTPGRTAATAGGGAERPQMADRSFLGRRHIDGGCAAPSGPVRGPQELSRDQELPDPGAGPPGLQKGVHGSNRAFRGGRQGGGLTYVVVVTEIDRRRHHHGIERAAIRRRRRKHRHPGRRTQRNARRRSRQAWQRGGIRYPPSSVPTIADISGMTGERTCLVKS